MAGWAEFRGALDRALLAGAVRFGGRFAAYTLLAPQVLPCRVVLGGKHWAENYTALIQPYERDRATMAVRKKVIRWDGVPNYGMRPENLWGHIIFLLFHRNAREVFVPAVRVVAGSYSFNPMDLTKSLYTERGA